MKIPNVFIPEKDLEHVCQRYLEKPKNKMKDLVARINTKMAFESIDINEDMRKEMGLYIKLEEKQAETYRNGDFRKLISYMINQNIKSENEEDRLISLNVKEMLSEQNPKYKIFEIYIHDSETGDYVRNVNDPDITPMSLKDKIKPYLKHTVIPSKEGVKKEIDYIDIVVGMNIAVSP